MLAPMDRLKGGFRSLARGAFPDQAYRYLHRAKLVKQLPGLRRVEVVPDDSALPPMANIPLKIGVPGVEVTIPPGHYVMVGWEDARPDRPYATLWTPGAGGVIPLKVEILGRQVEIGGDGNVPMSANMRGTEYRQAENIFLHALQAYVTAIKPTADISGVATAAITAAITAFGAPTDIVALSKIVKTA